MITASDLAAGLAARSKGGAGGSAMRRDVPVLEPTMPLSAALDPLERAGVAWVVERDALVGLLTVEQIAAYAELHHR
jgi:hypothetical protein